MISNVIDPIPRKRKIGEINLLKQRPPHNLKLEFLYDSNFRPAAIPTQQTKKRKLNEKSVATWTPDFAPSKKQSRRKKQTKTKRNAGYKGSTKQETKVCEYCHQQSTLSVHGRYYLCNSKTQPGLKICNACKSWEYRNGNLVPRDQRRKAYHSRPQRQPFIHHDQRYYDPTKGTSVEVFSDSDTDSVDFTTLTLNDSPDIRPVGQTSEFEGVSWDAMYGKWKAEYGKGSEDHVVGLFDLEVDAANAYARTVASKMQEQENENNATFVKTTPTDYRICQYCSDPSKECVIRLNGRSKNNLCMECYQIQVLKSLESQPHT